MARKTTAFYVYKVPDHLLHLPEKLHYSMNAMGGVTVNWKIAGVAKACLARKLVLGQTMALQIGKFAPS